MASTADATPGFADTEQLHRIKETAREVAANYEDQYWRDVADAEREPTEFWQECAEAGFLGTTIPEAYGGEGLGLVELSAIVQTLVEEGCMGAGMLFVVNVVFGGVTLTEHGTEAQKEQYLEAIADGELNFCMALTEPNAGHNAPNLDTAAEPQGDGTFLINGSKQWISGVDRADKMLLVARTTPKDEVERRTEGITLFLADPGDPAISLRELDVGIPTPEKQFELTFEDYAATEDDIIGTRGEGLYQLFDTVNPERVLGAASAIGTGHNALERAVNYASDREVFGQPVGAHQGVQHPIADAHSKVAAAELLAKKAAWLIDEGDDPLRAAEVSNMAKLRATEAGHEAADVAVQTHGGNGFSREYTVIDLWKGSRLGRVAPGSTEMMRNHIAEHALGLPRSY